jgi:hypothetical protein
MLQQHVPYESTQIVHITDTTDKPAEQKIRGAYALHKGNHGIYADIDFVPARDTLEIGVTASELITNTQRPHNLLVAVNCAPPDKSGGTQNNARRDFHFADLGDGVIVGGTVNGLEISYARPLITDLYQLKTTNELGSQFRSLEVLPEALIKFSIPEIRQDLIEKDVLVRVDPDAIIIPVPDVTHVCQADNFGNVKLYLTEHDQRLLQEAAKDKEEIQIAFYDCSAELLALRPEIPLVFLTSCKILSEFKATATETLFELPINSNVIALNSSSSRIVGPYQDDKVPFIATLRDHPAKTEPNYAVPMVGNLVRLTFS